MPTKRRGSMWQVDFRWNGERIRRGGFSAEPAALQWEAWAKQRLSTGQPIEEVTASTGETWTLEKLRAAVESRYWRGTANEDNAVRNSEECVALLGSSRHPRDITGTDIDQLVDSLRKKGNAAATINRKLSALGKMYTHALSRGIVDKRPPIERVKESDGRIRYYSYEEEARFLEASPPVLRDLLVFLLDTGCRLGEALRLQGQDISDGFARFHETKNGKGRAVPLTDRVLDMMERRGRTGQNELVFAGWRDRFAVAAAWASVREQVGLQKDQEAVIHAMRHTCASRLVQAGVSILVVQQWLGHRTLTMTMRYAHLAPHSLNGARDVLNRLVTTAPDVVRFGTPTAGAVTPVTSVSDTAAA